MIALQNNSSAFPASVFDFQGSQDGRFGWFLLTHHPENDHCLEEIQTQIKLDLRNSGLLNVSKLEIEAWLKTFFTEFHWKLHAKFRRTELKEKGISLLLAVIYDHEIFVVEFGRMLCGICNKSGLQPAGRAWQNFHVKSLAEMNLLGMQEAEIGIKPFRILLAEEQRFIAIPGLIAEKLAKQNTDTQTINTILPAIFGEQQGCFFILEGKTRLLIPRKRKWKPFHFSALLITVITLLAILYMQFGNRWLESSARRMKLIISNKSKLTVEQIPQYLKIESETLKRQLKTIERIANLPARNITLKEAWETDLQFLVTSAPSFDLDNIYVASDNNLMAYDKKQNKLQWKRALKANIREVSVIQGNLMVFLEDQTLLCLKKGNTVLWEKTFVDAHTGKRSLIPFEITSEEDPRLNGSILVIPGEKGLYIYDVYSGYLLSQIMFTTHLQHLSPYDAFDNCFYVVVADGILRINLNVVN